MERPEMTKTELHEIVEEHRQGLAYWQTQRRRADEAIRACLERSFNAQRQLLQHDRADIHPMDVNTLGSPDTQIRD